MEEKKNGVGIIGKLLGKKQEPEFSAEKAWIESTYGKGSYKEINIRIKEKQDYIKSSIENKFRQIYQNGYNGYNGYSGYHCVVDIEEDLVSSIETIFEPFIKSGFTFINLSEQVKDIDEPHVYLISWKNAFKNKNDVQIDENNDENKEIKLIEG